MSTANFQRAEIARLTARAEAAERDLATARRERDGYQQSAQHHMVNAIRGWAAERRLAELAGTVRMIAAQGGIHAAAHLVLRLENLLDRQAREAGARDECAACGTGDGSCPEHPREGEAGAPRCSICKRAWAAANQRPGDAERRLAELIALAERCREVHAMRDDSEAVRDLCRWLDRQAREAGARETGGSDVDSPGRNGGAVDTADRVDTGPVSDGATAQLTAAQVVERVRHRSRVQPPSDSYTPATSEWTERDAIALVERFAAEHAERERDCAERAERMFGIDIVTADPAQLAASGVADRVHELAYAGHWAEAIALVERFRDEAVQRAIALRLSGTPPDTWRWMPSDDNHLAGMGDRMEVTINAGTMRAELERFRDEAVAEVVVKQLKAHAEHVAKLRDELDAAERRVEAKDREWRAAHVLKDDQHISEMERLREQLAERDAEIARLREKLDRVDHDLMHERGQKQVADAFYSALIEHGMPVNVEPLTWLVERLRAEPPPARADETVLFAAQLRRAALLVQHLRAERKRSGFVGDAYRQWVDSWGSALNKLESALAAEPQPSDGGDGPGSPLRGAAGRAAALLEYVDDPKARDAMVMLYDAIKGIPVRDNSRDVARHLAAAADAVQERKHACLGMAMMGDLTADSQFWRRVAEQLEVAERDLRARSLALRDAGAGEG